LAIPIRIRIGNRDTGKTYLGGCMNCRSASSFNEFDYNGQVSVNCPLQLRMYVCCMPVVRPVTVI